MSKTFRVAGLAPDIARLRAREDAGPWTLAQSFELGTVSPPLSPELLAAIAPFRTVADGGTGANVPDLSAITVGVSAGTIPRQSGVAFSLFSTDPNYYAFAMFGTAKWTFSQHTGEDYVFRSLSGKLAGDTAGEAFGPYVGHVYVTGPGTGVATPLAHEWSVTLSYPGLPDRTITHLDGAKDLRASIDAGSDVAVNAILVHDDDHWYAGRTTYWHPADGTYASDQAFHDAMMSDPTANGVYDTGSLTVADFKVTDDLQSLTVALSAASTGNPRTGERLLLRAGTTLTFSDVAVHAMQVQGIRVDRFGAGADPVIDASAHTAGGGDMIAIDRNGDVLNIRLIGPYDPVNPGTAPARHYELMGIQSGPSANENAWSDGTVFRAHISNVSSCYLKTWGSARTVIADCHWHDWFNYGTWPSSQHESAMVGCRIAQNPNARQLGRIAKDGGGGQSNISNSPQQPFRDKFDWGNLTGPLEVRAPDNSNLNYGQRPPGGTIPAGYDPFGDPRLTNDPPGTWGWGTHPYDTDNGGTAAWDFIIRYHSGIIFPGVEEAVTWDGTEGVWGKAQDEGIWKNAFNDSYHKCALHGPVRIDRGSSRFGFHQMELASHNGWATNGDLFKKIPDPVTGRYDLMQDNNNAYQIQGSARLWTSNPRITYIDGNYTLTEHGMSIWRVVSERGSFGMQMQLIGPQAESIDALYSHQGIVMDGVIAYGSPYGTIRLDFARCVVRNSLAVADGDSFRDGPADRTAISCDGGGWGIDNDDNLQSPVYAYNCTAVITGNSPDHTGQFFSDDDRRLESPPGRRPTLEWNNARIKATVDIASYIDPVDSYSLTTATTPTNGTETFHYAPGPGSNILRASLALQPKYDLEGNERPARAAIGAWEMQGG